MYIDMKKPNKYQIIDFIERFIKYQEDALEDINRLCPESYGGAFHKGRLEAAEIILNYINTGE